MTSQIVALFLLLTPCLLGAVWMYNNWRRPRPSSFALWASLGTIHLIQLKFEKATAQFEKILQKAERIDPKQSDQYRLGAHVGLLAVALHDSDRSEIDEQQQRIDELAAQVAEPTDPIVLSALCHLSETYLFNSKPESAEILASGIERQLQRVQNDAIPNAVNTLLHLAKAFVLRGHFPKSRRILEQADQLVKRVNLSKNQQDILRIRILETEAAFSLRDANPGQCREVLSRAFEIGHGIESGWLLQLHDIAGLCSLRLESDFAAARKSFVLAYGDIEPDSPYQHLRLAAVELHQGNLSATKQLLKQVSLEHRQDGLADFFCKRTAASLATSLGRDDSSWFVVDARTSAIEQFGPDVLDEMELRLLQAIALLHQDEHFEAGCIAVEVREEIKQACRADHPLVIKAHLTVAETCLVSVTNATAKLTDGPQAFLDQFHRALKEAADLLQSQTLPLLAAYSSELQARGLLHGNRPELALPLIEESLRDSQPLLVQTHPDMLIRDAIRMKCLLEMGQADNDQFQQAVEKLAAIVEGTHYPLRYLQK